MRANRKQVETSMNQIAESKAQSNESHRLQVMPYIQIKTERMKVDYSNRIDPIVDIYVESNVIINGESNGHYVSIIQTQEILEGAYHGTGDSSKDCCVLLYVVLSNCGDGIAHYVELKIECDGHIINIPGRYVITSRGGIIGANCAIHSTTLDNTEILFIDKKFSLIEPVKPQKVTLHVYYQDIIGNKYSQSYPFLILRYQDRIVLHTHDSFITPPERDVADNSGK